MPNGGPDNCLSCHFNLGRRSHGRRDDDDDLAPYGYRRHNYCTIRRIDIPDPAYTYCANRFMTPDSEPYTLPVGPVLASNNPFRGVAGREVWIPSPDTEEIRRYLLEMVRNPTRGYGSYANPFPMEVFVRPYMAAATQLVQWRDRRVIGALEELIEHPAFQDRRYDDRRNSVRAFLDDVRAYLDSRRRPGKVSAKSRRRTKARTRRQRNRNRSRM